jgi:hypothetical protein
MYYTNLFSPETYEAFGRSDRQISGFRMRQLAWAKRIKPGDRFICYMTKLSRWIGVLEVVSESFTDESPLFYTDGDPFVVRFKVRTLAWLPKDKTVPIHDKKVWEALSFTRDCEPSSSVWTGKVRTSLNRLSNEDGAFLESLILGQRDAGEAYPIDEDEFQRLILRQIHRTDKVVTVAVPEDDPIGEVGGTSGEPARESIKIQALLARCGEKMGFRIWLPKSDRMAVLREWTAEDGSLIEILPLNYDETTLKTIEQIDVLWLKGRSIARAFEVEHTTAIYSGLLRMADLLALQPNMNIRLHIVAPVERREKVFTEIRRPVFSLLEKGPLSESCTFLSYDSVRELSGLKHLEHTSDTVLVEYEEEPE